MIYFHYSIVSTVYISPLLPQVFNEENFHSLIQSPMNQLNILIQNICLQTSISLQLF